MISIRTHRTEQGSALVVVIILLFLMSAFLLAMHDYTDGVGSETAHTSDYLRANAAAGAAADVVIGRLIQWVNSNSSYTPSIQDCATVGVPGNSTFPAITGAVTFPAGSYLSNFTVSTPIVYPVLPDDTVVTNPSASNYLTNVSQRINVSDNSPTSVARYYFTHSAEENAKSAACKAMTYQITVTVTPKVTTLSSSQSITLVRYLRIDKVNPFAWCTYRNGNCVYANTNTYVGPLYIAGNVSFYSPTTFENSVLYGVSSVNYGANFANGGYANQVQQTSLLSLIPNLTNSMAVNSSGVRLASYETNTTPGGAANSTTADPADMFSTREVIEPPTNPANDTTPPVFQNARIYNQADVRIQVSVATVGNSKVVTEKVVNANGTTVSAATNAWVTPLLAAVNVNTAAAGTSGAFMDRDRSTTQSVQSTDIDVGALTTVMNANPSVFPTGIIYVWDTTDASGGNALMGVRLWDAGVLPNTGLVVGTDDPIYMKGDFNTGATLPANATINTPPTVVPYSDNGMGFNSNPTTEDQRTVSGYTIKPAGLFGDSMTELSNAWTDTNSMNTETASNTTYNLVEGWTTMSANELRPNDTYLDPQSRANPLWLENWGGARRTMSGEEFCVWHSKYGDNTAENFNGGWLGDISYDSKATALKLNWGSLVFVRDRVARQ
jgi:hypothetical protein